MIQTWKVMLEICESRHISPELVCRPKSFTEHHQCAARASVLREMASQGVAIKQIRIVTGEDFSESAIRKILENGHGPNLESLPTRQMEQI